MTRPNFVTNSNNSFYKSSIYKFIIRWFFSTNHKCGVKTSSVLGASTLYRNAVTVKPLIIYLKYSKKIKQIFKVFIVKSLGKRTSIWVSSIRKACYLNIMDKKKWVYPSILFYGEKRLHIDLSCFFNVRNNLIVSQNLEETFTKYEQLKYNHKNDFGCLLKRSGRCRKPWNYNNLSGNVAPLSNAKREFSSLKSRKLKKLNERKNKHFNLIEVLADVNFLQEIYLNVKPQKYFRLNELDYNWFCRTSEKLVVGSFQFQPSIKVLVSFNYIKSKTKLFFVTPLSEKIVQQGMKMLLETIYEKKFLDTSHGFRPFKGVHKALEMIQLNWIGASWFLKFDVGKCYANIDFHRFINLLKEEIKDQRFLDLVAKLFNVHFASLGKNLDFSVFKTSVQKSSIFKIFLNIYLHKLDLEIAKINKEDPVDKNFERSFLCSLDPKFFRVRYVRYANHFLLGVSGSKKFALKIRDRIITFVRSDLKLTFYNTSLIQHINAGTVEFLGMVISSGFSFEFSKKLGTKFQLAKKNVNDNIKLHTSGLSVKKYKITRIILKYILKSDSKIVDNFCAKNIITTLQELTNLNSSYSINFSDYYINFFETVFGGKALITNKLENSLEISKQAAGKLQKNLTVLCKKYIKNHSNQILIKPYSVTFQIIAPLVDINRKLKKNGIISKLNKPKSIKNLIKWPDDKIVIWYRALGRSLLNYYSCCKNFCKVKNYVDYMIRWSAIHTLAEKYKSSCKIIIAKYTKDLILKDKYGVITASFLSYKEIKLMTRHFRSNVLHNTVDKIFEKIR